MKMKFQNRSRKKVDSIWSSIIYKVTVPCLIISSILLGVPYYIRHSFASYASSHELVIDVESIHYNWRVWKLPSIILHKVAIKNMGLNPTFTNVSASSILIEPNYKEFFKSFLKNYNLFINIQSLKISLANGSVLEGETITSNLYYKNSICKIHDFSVIPFKVKLGKEQSSSRKDENHKTCQGRLVIYEVKGEGQYYLIDRELEMYLKAPPALAQMPVGAVYSLQAKGKIKFLGGMPYIYAKNLDDPGVRGKITFTIDNFSNFLHHLNQAELISTIAENIGTIIGLPMPRIDPFTHQTEIFTNAVSLEMTFHPDGTYLGSMKL
ncbi:MAG: hypothetical protein K2Y18_08870 [Alphaproteobacteria bacterium]|nr:hypothetical protein [Alphaproteobacteria bacterium]